MTTPKLDPADAEKIARLALEWERTRTAYLPGTTITSMEHGAASMALTKACRKVLEGNDEA